MTTPLAVARYVTDGVTLTDDPPAEFRPALPELLALARELTARVVEQGGRRASLVSANGCVVPRQACIGSCGQRRSELVPTDPRRRRSEPADLWICVAFAERDRGSRASPSRRAAAMAELPVRRVGWV